MISRRMTKREPVNGTAQFRGIVKALRPASFTGIVETSFGLTLGSRWDSTGRRLSVPARKDFRKPKKLFGTPRRQGRRTVAASNYSLFSSIRLNLTLWPRTRAFLTKAAAHNALTNPVSFRSTLHTAGLRSERLVTERFLRESLSLFRLPGERIREAGSAAGREQVLRLIFGVRDLPFPQNRASRSVSMSGSRMPRASLPSTAFIQISGAAKRHAKLFSEKLMASARGRDSARIEVMQNSPLIVLPRFNFVVSDPTLHILLQQDSARSTRTVEFATLRHLPTMLLRSHGNKFEPSPYSSSFSMIQLTLPTQRRDDSEALAPRVSRFGPPPPLQYAKQGALIAHELADSLRDLRQSLGDIAKAPAPVSSPQIDKLTRQVYDQLKRELQIERERRGI